MYTLIVLLKMIFFEIVKFFHIRVMFININNNFYNIRFYSKCIILIVFFKKLIKKALFQCKRTFI